MMPVVVVALLAGCGPKADVAARCEAISKTSKVAATSEDWRYWDESCREWGRPPDLWTRPGRRVETVPRERPAWRRRSHSSARLRSGRPGSAPMATTFCPPRAGPNTPPPAGTTRTSG